VLGLTCYNGLGRDFPQTLNPDRLMMKPQVERAIWETELYLTLFITTSGGW
jgi:hypothetical protein